MTPQERVKMEADKHSAKVAVEKAAAESKAADKVEAAAEKAQDLAHEQAADDLHVDQKKFDALVKEKQAAGLTHEMAFECAHKQFAHDAEVVKAKKTAKA